MHIPIKAQKYAMEIETPNSQFWLTLERKVGKWDHEGISPGLLLYL